MRWEWSVLVVLIGCTTPQQADLDIRMDSGPRLDSGGDPDDVGGRLDAAAPDASAATADASSATIDASPAPDTMPGDYLLTVSTSNGGTVSVSVDSVVIGNCGQAQTCDFSIAAGSLAFLSATGVTLSFCSWSGDCAGAGSTCPLQMDAAKSTSAFFQSSDQDCL